MAKNRVAFHIANRMVHGLVLRPGKRGWAMEAAAAAPAPDDDQQDLAPLFKSLARQLKLAGGQPVTVCLAKQQAIIRSVQLPSTDPAELSQMARFEAERHIPFNAERHCIGWHVMRSKGVEGSDVLLGAVDGPVVARALDGLSGAGLAPDGITISSTCLVNSLFHVQKEAFAKRTQAIVSLGLDSLDLIFLHQGRVLYARSAALDLRGVLEGWIGWKADAGAPPPDQAKLATAALMIDLAKLEAPEEEASMAPVQRWIDRVGQELQRTYDFARREMKCPPIAAIALTGEGAMLRNLHPLLAKGGEVEVETLNPVGGLPGGEGQKLPFRGLELTIAFGSLIGRHEPGAYNVDLTPESHYRAAAKKSLIRRLAVTAALLVAAGGASMYAWGAHEEMQQRSLADYKRIDDAMQPVVAELQAMETKRKIIQTFINDPNAALPVFEALVSPPVVPGSVFLEKVSFVKGDSVTVEGRAKSIPDITQFVTQLDASGRFQPVQLTRQSPSTLENKPVYAFTIECPLKSAEKGEASG